jgi:hypothetical protein
MPRPPTFSLLVPTRQRTVPLARLLHSLAATAADPEALEVILVVDADDRDSRAFRCDRLAMKHVVVAPGLPMGTLNMAAYEASAGAYLMLLNDDVVAHTRRWDRKVLSCLQRFPDGIVLVHTNDHLFREVLCTFPIVSRTFCEWAGGICPRTYERYRIDDHIEDVFNLLGVLGERRTIYLPDVVFEHLKFTAQDDGSRTYIPDDAPLARDAARFQALLPQRKELALRLKEFLAAQAAPRRRQCWRARLARVTDSFALRVPGRLRVESETRKLRYRLASLLRRLGGCVCRRDWRGAVQILGDRRRRQLGRPGGQGHVQPAGEQVPF